MCDLSKPAARKSIVCTTTTAAIAVGAAAAVDAGAGAGASSGARPEVATHHMPSDECARQEWRLAA